MKKWLYLVLPVAMLGIFLVFYFANLKETEEKERMHAEKAAADQRAADAKKAEAEEKARKDAVRRAEEKAKEDAAKEAEKAAKWKKEGDQIASDTAEAVLRTDKATKEANDLDIKLDALHRQKDAENRAMFDATKQVEKSRVDRQNAEFEIQRLTDMVAKRASTSSMANPPPPPPPPAGT